MIDQSNDAIFIPFNKAKLEILLRLSIMFTIGGFFLALAILINHSIFTISICSLGMLILLICLPLTIYLTKRSTDKCAGVTIQESGIIDNTILLPIGSISWKDIQNIEIINVKTGGLLIIRVQNPIEYIQKQSSFIKRKILKSFFKGYKSPIIITSNDLTENINEVKKVLLEKLQKSKH